jgi:type I restriction enzyme S subunit
MNRYPNKPLGELCSVVAGGTPSRNRADFYDGGIPWVKIGDMLQGTVTHTEETISRLGLHSSSAKLLPPGTVLVSIFATIGRTAVLAIEAATNQAIAGVTPKNPQEIGPEFLRFFLNYSVSNLTAEARGVAQLNINGKILKSLPIPVPPLAEQERIVKLLEEADELRKLRAQADRRTAHLIPALFHEVFGDPATNPFYWPTEYVGGLFDQKRSGAKCGPFGSALKKHEYVESGIPVWGIPNILPNQFIEEGSQFISPTKFEELRPYSIESGDLLLSRAGTVGRICVARPKAKASIMGTNLVRLAVNHQRIVPDFFSALITHFGREVGRLRANSDEGAYSFMNTTVLKKLRIYVPPLPLQKEFAKRVTETRELEAKQAASRERLDALSQSMLHRAFGGEL